MWTTEANRIVRDARASFEKRHSLAVVVTIEFRARWRKDKKTAPLLADELAIIIEKAIPAEVLAGNIFQKAVRLKDPHPTVSWIFVGPTESSLGGRWVPSFAGYVRHVTADDIRETVRRKEPEVHVYKQAAPVSWLLIDCDLTGQGILSVAPHLSIPFTVTSAFDRVFCCGFGLLYVLCFLRRF